MGATLYLEGFFHLMQLFDESIPENSQPAAFTPGSIQQQDCPAGK
jgi:hypothetical protein